MVRWVSRACKHRPADLAYCRWARNHGAVVCPQIRLNPNNGFWQSVEKIPAGSQLISVPMDISIQAPAPQTDTHFGTARMSLPHRWADLAKEVCFLAGTEGPTQHLFAQRLLERFDEELSLQTPTEDSNDVGDDYCDIDDHAGREGTCINAATAPASSFPSPTAQRLATEFQSSLALLRTILPSHIASHSRSAFGVVLSTALESPPFPFEIIPLIERCKPQYSSIDAINTRLTARDGQGDDDRPCYVLLSDQVIEPGDDLCVAFHDLSHDEQMRSAWSGSLDDQLLVRFRVV